MDDRPAPYADASAHLRDELRRVWLRVEYQIRRGWERGILPRIVDEASVGVWSPDHLGGMFLAAHEDHAGASSPPETDAGAARVLDAWLAWSRKVDSRIQATIEARLRLPLVELARCFGLTRRQWATLLYALTPEVDPNLLTAYRYLSHDPSCRGLDARLLALLVYDTPESRAHLSRDLAPTSPLLFYRLLEQDDPMGQHDAMLYRRLRPAARLVQMLGGEGADLDPQLADVAELRDGAVHGIFPATHLQQAQAALQGHDVFLVVQGQRGTGKRLLVQLAAARWEKRVLLVDARRLAVVPPHAQRPVLRGLLREAALLDAVPVVPDIDDVIALLPEREELPPFVVALAAEHRGPIALTVNRERLPRIYQRPMVHLTLDVPPLPVRTALWKQNVPSLDEEQATQLSGRFAIPGGIVVMAARAAMAERLPEEGPPAVTDLDRAVASQLHDRIQRLGRRIDAHFDLEDLVVDDDTRDTLKEIIAAVRERRHVHEKWGLRGAPGVSVLFSGDPGVGKTMSATVLSRRLGLAIYEVDLSQVVSKWVGETEKNLADVFEAAEPGHVVLLFNEADSLFGKRTTEMKSANDRYANLEVNYLLQRLERFGGLAILTTNLGKAIDQAFRRRFAYDVQFQFPTVEMREELWRRAIPKQARVGAIDYAALAKRFELSGGFIKVAIERAAYLASAAGEPIADELVILTVERMYRERGKLAPIGKLES